MEQTLNTETKPESCLASVSGSVFFETGKYYHKIWVNGDEHRYFKCDRNLSL